MPSFKVFLVAYLLNSFCIDYVILCLQKNRSVRYKAWSVQSFVPYVFCLQINARNAIFGFTLGVAIVEVCVTSLVSLLLVFIEMYIMMIILISCS